MQKTKIQKRICINRHNGSQISDVKPSRSDIKPGMSDVKPGMSDIKLGISDAKLA